MSTSSPYQVERLTTFGQLAVLREEWDALLDAIPEAPVFLSWEWIASWWEHYGNGRQLWLLTVRSSAGQLVGLAPLMCEPQQLGPLTIRVLEVIGSGIVYPVHLDFPALASERPAVLRALDDYLQHTGRWDALSVAAVAEDSPLPEVLASQGTRRGSRIASPFMPLADSWETFTRRLSKKLRRNLRYFHTLLENEHTEVAFSCLNDPAELPLAMDRLAELNCSRRHALGLSSAFDDPAFTQFHKAVASLALTKGWLRLYQLTVDGRTIAIFYCLLYHNHLYAYQMGFDTAWGRYSPGRLLNAFGIESAIGEGAIELDWLAGEEPYKFEWTDQVRVETELLLSRTWRGKLWTAWRGSREKLAQEARELLPPAIRQRLIRLVTPPASPAAHQKDKSSPKHAKRTENT